MRGNLSYAGPMSKPSPPKRITKEYLEAAALYYLERFAASAESLRRVLLGRGPRAARYYIDDQLDGTELAEA